MKKTIIKIVTTFFFFAVLYLILVLAFGTKEYRIKCSGSFNGEDNKQVFIKVERYRPIVFWGDGDGIMLVRGVFNDFYRFRKDGVILALSRYDGSPIGGYYLDTDEININPDKSLVNSFSGHCSAYKPALPEKDF